MRGVAAIAGRELRALFRSPLAWLVLAGAAFVMAWLFLWLVQNFLAVSSQAAPGASAPGVTGAAAAPAFFWAAVILVILTPLMAMRTLAEERRSGTIRLLRAAPVSTTAIVLGKFAALLLFLWLVVAMAAAMPLTLALGTSLDFGRIGAGVLGLALVTAAFGAVSLFMSALTRQPLLAALASFGALIVLWIINLAAGAPGAVSPLAWLAFQPHLGNLLRGAVASADVAYFLILTALFLGLTVWRLDMERLGG